MTTILRPEEEEIASYYDPEKNTITLNVPPPEAFQDETEELIVEARVRKKGRCPCKRRDSAPLSSSSTSGWGQTCLMVGVVLFLIVLSGYIGYSFNKVENSKSLVNTNQTEEGPLPEFHQDAQQTPPQEEAPPEEVPQEEAPQEESPQETAPPETAPPEAATVVPEVTPAPTPLTREGRIAQQIDMYKNGGALLLSFNIQNCGGITICTELGKYLRHPKFVCMHPTEDDQVDEDYPDYAPWQYQATATNVHLVKKSFDFLLWTMGDFLPHDPNIHDTHWEHPTLVSFIVIREPISRSLSKDVVFEQKYSSIFVTHNADEATWMEFANEKSVNNNFMTRVLSADPTCCDGANTDRKYLEKAKELVQRFTFVLDFNCLDHSLTKMSEMLGTEIFHYGKAKDELFYHGPIKDAIPYPNVYDFLAEKNALDIELYEWSKQFAIVNCDEVYAAEAATEGDTATTDPNAAIEAEERIP